MAQTKKQPAPETPAMAKAWKAVEAAERARNDVSERISAHLTQQADNRAALAKATSEQARNAAADAFSAGNAAADVLPDEAVIRAEVHAQMLYQWSQVTLAEIRDRKATINAEKQAKLEPVLAKAAEAEEIEARAGVRKVDPGDGGPRAYLKRDAKAEQQLAELASKGISPGVSTMRHEEQLNREADTKRREQVKPLERLIVERCRNVFGRPAAKEIANGADLVGDDGQLALRETYLPNVRQRAEARLRGEAV
jgi:hypothetical protein